jgi:hypothetical protein
MLFKVSLRRLIKSLGMGSEVDTEKPLKDKALVGEALLECLIDNEPENFMDILDSFLQVNKKRVAQEASLSRATVQNAFPRWLTSHRIITQVGIGRTMLN